MPLVSHVEMLELIDNFHEEEKWSESMTQWLGFLHPFTAVQTLCLCGVSVVSHIANILGDLEEKGATEVLPALHTIELDCLEQDESEVLRALEPFLVVRKGLGHPIVMNFVSKY
jgi:hypothetical protein